MAVKSFQNKTIYAINVLIKNPPVAQLVEQLPLKEMVVGSNPTGRTRFEASDFAQRKYKINYKNRYGQVAELVYALVLGTSSVRIEGSSPSLPTK